MMHSAPALLTVVVLASTALARAQTSTWKIDPAHSAANFTVRHMGISNVHGRFGGVNGEIRIDPSDFTKSSVKATIDTTTVDTGMPMRDNDLKSDHFFDVAKFPSMTFVSKSVKKSGDGYEVTGDLTMHGVTKSALLTLESPSGELAMGKQTRRGFDATTTIHRKDFGLTFDEGPTSAGDALVSDEVKVELEVEGVKQ